MTTVTETNWQVQFVGDYFTLTTYVDATDEEQAIASAEAFLNEEYGMDMWSQANEAEAVGVDE
jgi:hypothetical protein